MSVTLYLLMNLQDMTDMNHIGGFCWTSPRKGPACV
jgi:hypothetical protein